MMMMINIKTRQNKENEPINMNGIYKDNWVKLWHVCDKLKRIGIFLPLYILTKLMIIKSIQITSI